MSYIIRSTERTRGNASDYETKAMLYLLEYRDDSDEIYYFAVDFFNDVTGLNTKMNKAWDVQSKGAKNNSPKEIGRELVTLFKNYVSDLEFDNFILFLGGVSSSFRIDESKKVFGIENVEEKSIGKLKEGLIEESESKKYIDKATLTNDNIDGFLKQVVFVIDSKSKTEYIKDMIKVNEKYIPNDGILEGIFNQIRDMQSSKKNNRCVEGEKIENISDVIYYDRLINSKQLKLLVFNSFINNDVFHQSPPVYFRDIIRNFDGLKQNEIVEDCRLKISTVLFDKNNSDKFWELINLIYDTVLSNKKKNVKELFKLIQDKNIYLDSKLDVYAIMYLISSAKEALENENR